MNLKSKNQGKNPDGLLKIRDEIDSLNRKLIKIVAKRTALIPLVADYKIKNNLPRVDLEREKSIIEKCRRMAIEQEVNPDLIENIVKLLIEDAHRIELKKMGK